MNTYDNMKKVIANGIMPKEELLHYCDIFELNKRITDTQYNELVALINKGV